MKKILLTLGILFSSMVSFGYCYVSQTNINNYNLQYVSTLTWSDMNTTNFSYIMPDNNTYCLSINNGIVLGSSSLQINNLYCSNNSCATANSVNNLNGLRYVPSSTNITFYNNVFKFTSSATATEFSNFYDDNFICYTPYYGYLSNTTYTFMNTAYLRGVSSSNSPNLSVSVYKVNNSSSCPSCPTCSECEIHIGFNDITNNNQTQFLSETYVPNGVAKNYSVYYNSVYNSIDISNEYLTAEILVNSGVGNLSSCESSLSSCLSDNLSCSNSLGTCGNQLNSCNNALGNCMQGNVGTGINWSSLFINGIQHVGKPLINITIPQEINWDYTNSGTVFDLSVVGFNQDSDYIESIINLQNTKPTEDDFNKIVSEIIPLFVPGLLIIAFIYFIFRFLRKIF